MKLNVLQGVQERRPGYLNISPLGLPDTVYGTPQFLDMHVADGEAREILAIDVLDFLSPLSETRLPRRSSWC